jgi:hypothetical protein
VYRPGKSGGDSESNPTRNLCCGQVQDAGAEPAACPKQFKPISKKGADFMQTVKIEREQNNARSGRFSKRIGSTVYEVEVHFNQDAKETMNDKILRLVKDEAQNGRHDRKAAV